MNERVWFGFNRDPGRPIAGAEAQVGWHAYTLVRDVDREHVTENVIDAMVILCRPVRVASLGISYYPPQTFRYGGTRGGLVIKYRTIWGIFGIPPAALLLRSGIRMLRRVRRARRGHCRACGYDLRGTPGQCPECGAVAGTAAA